MTKNNLRRNGFISSYQLSNLKHQALLLRKVRAEIEAKAMGEHLSTSLTLMACSVFSYGLYVITCPGLAPPTVGRTLPRKSLTMKTSYRVAYSQS